MEHFSCKTKIISGPGGISALKDLRSQRLLLVTDPYFLKSGIAQKILNASNAPHTEVFSGVQPDPSVALAAEGTAAVNAFRPDTIVALGGGSAMDCAKAMAYFSHRELRFVAIPTTSGSGSEVTDFAILTHNNVKHPLIDPRLQPDVAILDSELLQTLPKSLIADTGFDVLTHAAEAFVAKNAGCITDTIAQEAFRIVFSGLLASYNGDLTVRLSIHTAATMAGIAFNQAGLGLCHGLSHSLGGVFHIPHGRLNAILLPAVISCNGCEKYAQLAKYVGLGATTPSIAMRNLKNELVRLRGKLNLPHTLAQAGVSFQALREHMDKLVQATLQDPCCQTNPIPGKEAMIRKVLWEVSGHG